MQSNKFLDSTVSPKFNWGKIKDQAQHQIQVVKSTASKVKGKLKAKGKPEAKKFSDATVSNKASAEDKEGRRNVLNNLISTTGATLTGIFKKPDTYVTNNTTNTVEEDNTMLYVGIGGAALLVVILIVVMLKK